MHKKFLSVRNRASGPGNNKKKGGPLPKVYKRPSSQAGQLTSSQAWDIIRLER